jgi:hypothetical protein
MSETIDCRSEAGVTMGLIDAMISIARIAAKRDLKNPAVQEALKDLAEDEDIKQVLSAALYARSAAWLDKLMEDK